MLRFGLVDVTEAQFGVMTILLISTVLGSSFWATEVSDTEHLGATVSTDLPIGCTQTIKTMSVQFDAPQNSKHLCLSKCYTIIAAMIEK